jgi:hypothetical protein
LKPRVQKQAVVERPRDQQNLQKLNSTKIYIMMSPRFLLILVAVSFVAFVAAQTPDTVLELISGSADFQVRYRAGTLPRWYLNGKTYYILGSLPCTDGLSPVWNGTDWYCGNFTGFPSGGDTLFDQLHCQAGQNVAWNGTNWVCGSDSDLLGSLNCPIGSIPVKQGSIFVCGTDSDLLASVVCQNGEILVTNGTTFNCAEPINKDTLATLNCTNGQTIKRFNGVWQCADDLDYFSFLNCSAGQVVKYSAAGNTFVCATDQDLLSTLGCIVGETLIGTAPNNFSCIPQPTPPGVPVSFIDGQTFTPSTGSLPATFDTYFGSPIGRELNSIQLINGLQIFALSYNFNKVPPAGFVFSINIYKRTGTASTLVQTINYATNSGLQQVSTSLDLFYTNQDQLYILYSYNGVSDATLSVTTVLFVRHFVF